MTKYLMLNIRHSTMISIANDIKLMMKTKRTTIRIPCFCKIKFTNSTYHVCKILLVNIVLKL